MIYVIGGTTASGKSSLAFKFARLIDGVIINADAFAIYQQLKIGTAKPSGEQLQEVENYMFNIRSVEEQFSIYEYQQEVRSIIQKCQKEDKPIIIVGGSGLYIRAVLYDYQFSKEKEKLDEAAYADLSNIDLHAKLAKLDKASAEQIHPNNRRRVLRALTIAKMSDTTKSVQLKSQKKAPLYNYVLVVLDAEKEELNLKIKNRVNEMFDKGLRKEVIQLTEHFPVNLQALQAIGYKEIIENPQENDMFLIDLISRKTIKYAKRQRTFFRHQFQGTTFYDVKEALTYLEAKYKECQNAKNA